MQRELESISYHRLQHRRNLSCRHSDRDRRPAPLSPRTTAPGRHADSRTETTSNFCA
jgi:hypothetical protein